MLLKRWEPFAELEGEFDRLLSHPFQPRYIWPRVWGKVGNVDTDVYMNADNLVVRATVPGAKPEDLNATIANNVLTIEGKSGSEEEGKEGEYLHRESRLGSFRRSVTLPRDLGIEKAEASYENGVLIVTIPRSEGSKPQALKINVKSVEGKKG